MADNIDKLFESIESDILDSDMKLKLGILYEQSLNEAIKAKESDMESKAFKELNDFKNGLVKQTDKFLDFFVEDFTKKNAPVIENSVKVKIAENVIKAFANLMEKFQLTISDKAFENDTALKEAESELNTITKQLMEAKKEIKTHKKASIILEHANKLSTDVQKTKLAEYAADIPLDKLFEGKVKVFGELMISESRSKAFTKSTISEKINEVEKNDKPVIFEENKTAIQTYIDLL